MKNFSLKIWKTGKNGRKGHLLNGGKTMMFVFAVVFLILSVVNFFEKGYNQTITIFLFIIAIFVILSVFFIIIGKEKITLKYNQNDDCVVFTKKDDIKYKLKEVQKIERINIERAIVKTKNLHTPGNYSVNNLMIHYRINFIYKDKNKFFDDFFIFQKKKEAYKITKYISGVNNKIKYNKKPKLITIKQSEL